MNGFDDWLSGAISNLPTLIRPQINSMLAENGLVLCKQIGDEIIEATGSKWRVTFYAIDIEPRILFSVCRWCEGEIKEDQLPFMCRSTVLVGALDGEIARTLDHYTVRILT